MAKLNMVKALNLALREEMERDPDVLVIGEDVGVDGGVFRVTEDLHRQFGNNRKYVDLFGLFAVDPRAEEAVLIEQIAGLERLKSAAVAGQARAAAAAGCAAAGR